MIFQTFLDSKKNMQSGQRKMDEETIIQDSREVSRSVKRKETGVNPHMDKCSELVRIRESRSLATRHNPYYLRALTEISKDEALAVSVCECTDCIMV